MALFLQEAVAAQDKGGMQSFTEAFASLIDLSEQQGVLVESLLTADYIIEQQSKNLSEGEALDKVKAFGKKAWASVKSFAQTVWAKVKEIARLVARKAKEWFAKIVSKFKGEEGTVSKAALIRAEKAPRILEKMLFLAEKGVVNGKAEGIKADYDKITGEMTALENEVKAASGDETIKKGVWEAHVKAIEGLSAQLEKAVSAQEAALGKLEGDENVQANIAAVRAGVSALQGTAAKITTFASTTMSAFRPKGEAAAA